MEQQELAKCWQNYDVEKCQRLARDRETRNVMGWMINDGWKEKSGCAYVKTWMNEIIFQTVAGKYFNITLDFSVL